MTGRISKTVIWISILMGALNLYSCKKDGSAPSAPGSPLPADILIGHVWYSYENRTNGTDTLSVYLNDSRVSRATTKFDSTHIFLTCMQQSSYNFKKDSTLPIECKCNVPEIVLNGAWQFSSENLINQLSFTMVRVDPYGSVDVDYIYQATLKQIDDTKFIFEMPGKYYFKWTTIMPNGDRIDSVHESNSIITTTFNAR